MTMNTIEKMLKFPKIFPLLHHPIPIRPKWEILPMTWTRKNISTYLRLILNSYQVETDRLKGGCIDSGAQRTAIDKRQADQFAHFANIELEITTYKWTYRFGNVSHAPCGEISIHLPIDSFFAQIKVKVLDVDISLLLGLDLLTKFKIVIDFDEIFMQSKLDGWVLPIFCRLGHACGEWTPSILYTEHELRRVHRHLFHPQTDRFSTLINRVNPDCELSKVDSNIEKIKATFDVCQRKADMPHRFRVAIPNGKWVFNKSVSLDLMKLDGQSIFTLSIRILDWARLAFWQVR